MGSRNYLEILPSVVCANDVALEIGRQVPSARVLPHHQGCSQLPPELDRVEDALTGLGCSPNAGAVLVVSLGCEGVNAERLAQRIAENGTPVDIVGIQRVGGTQRAVVQGVRKAEKLVRLLEKSKREPVDASESVIALKCGGSDATSGLASNCAIGYVTDRLVDMGAAVIFGETTEMMGAEHILARRGRTEQVGQDIYRIVREMETRVKAFGCDMRRGQPTPGNIEGGLSSIEEKSLGSIAKSGSRTIEGVIGYTEQLWPRRGLWIKDSPGREMELLTGMALGGAQAVLFSTGRGAPQGFPIVPVLKICGNPMTYERMRGDMDYNAGEILTGRKSVEQCGEEILARLFDTLSGRETQSEWNRCLSGVDIWCQGTLV